MIHVDLSILRHDDNCRYLDDEQFCTCGAADYERLQIVTAQLDGANERIRELEADLKTAFDESWKARAKVTELETSLTSERAVLDRLLEALRQFVPLNAFKENGVWFAGNDEIASQVYDDQAEALDAIAEVESMRKEQE